MLKRQTIKNQTNLITIFRSRPEFDVVSLIYNIITKEDVEETKKTIVKMLYIYDVSEDLNDFIIFYISRLANEFNRPTKEFLTEGYKPKIKNKRILDYINCNNIQENMFLFYRKRKEDEIRNRRAYGLKRRII